MPATQKRAPTVGVFDDPSRALAAVEALEKAGFSQHAIGVLSPSHARASKIARATHVEDESGVTSLLDEVAAALSGVLGVIFLPGIGPVSTTGMVGAAVESAVSGEGEGSITGALVGMGIPVDAAEQYEDAVRGGGILVVVDAGVRAGEARSILDEAGRTAGS